ncbi:MAG: RrF2 family transcriptional regulator [Planctomycetota bacterium]|jgi:Rrf2 family protein
MRIPQKWRYALRAVFELTYRGGPGPIKVSDIAASQDIPPRFLEVILNQLKHVGIVDSRRGNDGGYMLIRSPYDLSVGEIIRSLDGNDGPLGGKSNNNNGQLYSDCAIIPMWDEGWNAMWEVYDNTTFQQLVDKAKRINEKYVPLFNI